MSRAFRVVIAYAALFGGVCTTGCRDVLGGDAPDVVTRRWFTPLPFTYEWPATPALRGGSVFVADAKGIAAFDTQSGVLRWRAALFDDAGSSGDILTAADRACVADFFGGSGCVDVASGTPLWNAAPDSAWSYQHAADASRLYYGTHDHKVVARNLSDGSIAWTLDLAPGAPFMTLVRGVALNGDTLYATTARWLNANGFLSTGDLVAIDRSTGRELWRYTAAGDKSDFQAGVVFVGTIAIVSDTYTGTLRGIDLTSHQQVWQTNSGPDRYVDAESNPVVAGDTVFAGSTDTQIYAFNARTGAELWHVGGNAGSLGSTALCGRLVLVVPWTSGPLVAVDRMTRRVSQPRVMAGDDELFSRIVVDGNIAYAVGVKGMYSFRCAD
jgi:outer membrane protein assembly factor BamB